MRTGFSMIELIFVIVILGILSAVAIPKLAATRMDAQASRKAHMIMVGATEIAAYATARGVVENNLSIMSASIDLMEQNDEALLDTTAKKATFITPLSNGCIVMKIESNATVEVLKISFGNAVDDMCAAMQTLIDTSEYPMRLRGNFIKF